MNITALEIEIESAIAKQRHIEWIETQIAFHQKSIQFHEKSIAQDMAQIEQLQGWLRDELEEVEL